MITMRISVLLAFSLLPKKEDAKKGGKKGKKDKKDKKKKDKKKDKKGSKKNKPEKVIVVVEKPKYVIEVGPPVGFSHIEYEIIPGRPKYQVDVVCWGPVAKVICADGEVTLKTFVDNNIAWVPITVKHVLNQLEVDELFNLHKHVVNYIIYPSKKKVGAKAKAEKAKAFFIREEDIDSSAKFTEAYINNPNLEKCEDENDKKMMDLEKEIKKILWECADVPGSKFNTEIVTRLEFLSDPLHDFQMNKIIDSITVGKVVECKDFVPICPPPLTDADLNKVVVTKKPKKGKGKKDKEKKDKGKKDKGKKSKDSKKSKGSKKGGKKEKGGGLLKISVPGEVFYTDPNLNIYDLRTPSLDIIHAYVLTTVDHLMKRVQKYNLNPLIIKIKKITNLPVDVLAQHRFNTIHAYYSIPYIAQCTTIEKPLAKDIKLNEGHAYFTDSLPKLKLLEFLQTQRLYVEIRGVRDQFTKSPQAHIFGCERNDDNVSRRFKTSECITKLRSTEEPTTVTLAVACYDLSTLLKPTWDFLENASCHHPDSMMHQNFNVMYAKPNFIDGITVNEVNLGVLGKSKSSSPLMEGILADYGTSLKVEVYLSAPHNNLKEVFYNPDIYHRLFVVINYVEMATTLLNAVLLHNQMLMGPDVVVANFLKGNPTQGMLNDILKNDTQPWNSSAFAQAITGFVIDNGNSFAFFLEGLANGYLMDIWGKLMDMQRSIIKSFYNTEFCFERRIYTEFLRFGGIYTITLKTSLQEMMYQYGVYLEGNLPIPSWEALKKISLLFKCASIRAMIQYCLLPTALELISLDLELGVPFKWRTDNMAKSVSQIESEIYQEQSATEVLSQVNG